MSSVFVSEYFTMISTASVMSLLFTFLFSIILMLFGKGLFFKLEKSPSSSFIPVYNLIVLNEGLEINPVLTILYFVPFINLIYYIYVCYKLGYVFGEGYDYRLGLVFMPYMYFKFLGNSKKELDRKRQEEEERVRKEILGDALLYTDEKLKELNEQENDEESKVDSIFKSDVRRRAEDAPIYKASTKKNNNVKLDFDEMDDKHKVVFIETPRTSQVNDDIIKKVETTYIGSSDKTNKNHENEIDVYEIK